MTEESVRDRPLVLVADDEEDILELVSFVLEEAGYEVVQAVDGDAAVKLAKELAPDLAVIDVRMPRKDGYEVVEEMRADVGTGGIPVILLTARVRDTDVERGIEVGAADYIKKPFSPDDLRARLEAILRGGAAARGRARLEAVLGQRAAARGRRPAVEMPG